MQGIARRSQQGVFLHQANFPDQALNRRFRFASL